ncbi:MAG TPA: S-layer protein, partial [Planctomycetaceae bacterium]|nr:S-layer protein [Planctomycetaceae bacterium]
LQRIEVFPSEATVRSGHSQQLVVTAVYDDGTRRDVSRVVELRTNDSSLVEIDGAGLATAGKRTGQTAVIALLQGRVAVSRLTVPLETSRASWPEFPIANLIDRHVQRKLKTLGVAPSAVCDDAKFLRRVTLHLAGRIPRPDDIEAFLADGSPRKRAKLVSRLLASPDYADTFAQKWSALLRNKRRGQKDRIAGTITFHRWIRNAIASGMPFDRFVRSILTATGNVSVSPPAQWYAEVRYLDRYVDDTAQVFLGLRIGCARCHHHPFENFTQGDYYGLAAFFTRIGRREGIGVAERRAKETVFIKAAGSVKHPVTGNVVKPHGLGGPDLEVPPYADPRHRLVDWMATRENPYFARAFVNRMWAHCFGRGLVEPIDDMRVTNPATNPRLLDALANEFVDSGFNMRRVLELITTSTTYQLDSSANVDNLDETQGHSRFYPQRLSAEMLLDSIDQVTSRPTAYGGLPVGTRAMQLPDENYSNQFLKLFGRPPRESACECERTAAPSLSQSLFTLNDSFLLGKIFDAKSRAGVLATADGDHAARIRRLFLVALSRPATSIEVEKAVKYVVSESDAKTAYSNLMWALINTKEFQYNH